MSRRKNTCAGSGIVSNKKSSINGSNRKGLLTLSIPLPLFNRRQGDVDRALADVKKQEAAIDLVRRRIEKEVAMGPRMGVKGEVTRAPSDNA